MSSANPFLSIVAASRNDDHGGNLLARMQIFIDGLIDQCRRFDIPAELILVEWNPPEDRPKLADALSWPAEPGLLAVRIIEVPPAIHSRFEHSEALPLYQMVAKNVGIHRARGKFILATNIDILFSDALMERIAARELLGECFYRIDRYDVDEAILTDDSITDKLDFCAQNVIRINQRNGTHYPKTEEFDRIYKSRLQVVALALSLTLVFPMVIYRSYLYWQKLYFWTRKRRHPLFYGTRRFLRLQARRRPEGKLSAGDTFWLFCRMMLTNLARTPVRDWYRRLRRPRRRLRKVLWIQKHHDPNLDMRRWTLFKKFIVLIFLINFRRRVRNILRRLRRSFRRLNRFLLYRRHLGRGQKDSWPVTALKVLGFIPIVFGRPAARRLIWKRRQAWRDVAFEYRRRRLHTNACGDFTLLSRDRWFRLRGYAEYEMYSFHIDSLLCHSAACLGIREHILEDPARIYHMEHSEGSGFTPESRQALWLRIAKSRINRLSDDDFWALTLDMRFKKRSPIFNNEDWGLIQHDLPETNPTAPDMGQKIARVASSGV